MDDQYLYGYTLRIFDCDNSYKMSLYGIKFTVIYRYMRIFMGIKKLSNSRYEFYTRKYLLKEVKLP